jgi:hypothetical protein
VSEFDLVELGDGVALDACTVKPMAFDKVSLCVSWLVCPFDNVHPVKPCSSSRHVQGNLMMQRIVIGPWASVGCRVR